MRQLAPEVAVPELPEDPAGYIQALEQHRYFQVVSLGQEDLRRGEYYRNNARREQALSGSENVEDYLPRWRWWPAWALSRRSRWNAACN